MVDLHTILMAHLHLFFSFPFPFLVVFASYRTSGTCHARIWDCSSINQQSNVCKLCSQLTTPLFIITQHIQKENKETGRISSLVALYEEILSFEPHHIYSPSLRGHITSLATRSSNLAPSSNTFFCASFVCKIAQSTIQWFISLIKTIWSFAL